MNDFPDATRVLSLFAAFGSAGRVVAASGSLARQLSAAAILAMLALIDTAVCAEVVESFDYPQGGLSRCEGGSGWSGPWHVQSSENGGEWIVDKQGLHHPVLKSKDGFAALSPGQGSRYQRNFAEPFKTGVVYLSFLTRSSSRDADPYSAIELQLKGNGESHRIFQLGLLRNDDGNPNGGDESAFYARSRASVGGGGGDTALLAKFNTENNLFVVRFDFDARLATVFVNPDGDVDLTGSGDGSLTLFPKFSFDRICIANFAGENNFVVDEIRIADAPPALAPIGESNRLPD